MDVHDAVQPEGECIELKAKGQESSDAACNEIWQDWDLRCSKLHDKKCSEVLEEVRAVEAELRNIAN